MDKGQTGPDANSSGSASGGGDQQPPRSGSGNGDTPRNQSGTDSGTTGQDPDSSSNHTKITSKKKDSAGGIGPIKGYPEKGKDSWRASNDKLFKKAAKAFDKAHGLKPGDSLYLTPKQIKAWAMVESGGSKRAFTTDPMQSNVPGDWAPRKQTIAGLRQNEKMTPEKSINAALRWFWYKGTIHNAKFKVIGYRSLHDAFKDYNGKLEKFPNPHETHAEWYANKVISLGGG